MNIRYSFYVLMGLFLVLILTGCSNNKAVIDNCDNMACSIVASPKNTNIEKLELYHFHTTNQCYSCKTVGAYAEETVNTYFADELESGKIVFGHINGELPENRDLVIKYGVTGSSLWLGTYSGKEFKAEENVNVWYKIRDREDYMTYFKEIIEQKLAGD